MKTTDKKKAQDSEPKRNNIDADFNNHSPIIIQSGGGVAKHVNNLASNPRDEYEIQMEAGRAALAQKKQRLAEVAKLREENRKMDEQIQDEWRANAEARRRSEQRAKELARRQEGNSQSNIERDFLDNFDHDEEREYNDYKVIIHKMFNNFGHPGDTKHRQRNIDVFTGHAARKMLNLAVHKSGDPFLAGPARCLISQSLQDWRLQEQRQDHPNTSLPPLKTLDMVIGAAAVVIHHKYGRFKHVTTGFPDYRDGGQGQHNANYKPPQSRKGPNNGPSRRANSGSGPPPKKTAGPRPRWTPQNTEGQGTRNGPHL